MKLFRQGFIFVVLSFILYSVFGASDAFAATSPFRSATIVTTNGATSYTSLNNCFLTDGNTCDRALGESYGNLDFRGFGNFGDFGIPKEAKITKVRIRVVGKATNAIYVALSSGQKYTDNCQWPSDLWTLWELAGSTIKTKEFVTDVAVQWRPNSVNAYCLRWYNFENNDFVFRINYASDRKWSANIDNFEIAFDYEIPLTPTPTPVKTPLVIIPGIGGSELKTVNMEAWVRDNGHGGIFNHLYPDQEKVWVNNFQAGLPGDDDYFDILKMDIDGQTSLANLALTGNLLEGYKEAIDFFVKAGYELDKNLFVFPYDWRKDVALTAPLLDQKIEEIKQKSGSEKVDMVAHSMGGLVARNYISDAIKASKVRKLFTLGTPHLGSVKSLKTLRHGDCLRYKVGPACLSIPYAEVKDVFQNMISGFELAPTQKYFDFYLGQDSQHPYPYRTEAGYLNYTGIKNFMTSLNHNTSLFNPSEAFHSLDSNYSSTNGVDVVVIAGSGQPTLGQIIEEKTILLSGVQRVHKDLLDINGDGTVPLFSASLNDPSKSISFLGPAKVFYTNQNHGGLVSDGPALNLVKNILEGNSQLPGGVLTKAYSLTNGWLFSVHSPVNIHIYDSSGNHTGPTPGGFEENIPQSSYDTLDDAKFIYLPNDGQYSIKFEALDEGSFDFKIRKYKNDIVSTETLYENIPLAVTTKAETQFNTTSESPIIHLDKDGNGTIDEDFSPSAVLVGDAVYDKTPPVTKISLFGIQGDSDWYRSDVEVSLTAEDENNGSGANKIEYSLDDGKTVQAYSAPFTISAQGINKLKFRAIDFAGNKEDPKETEIKIDKTLPEAKIFINSNKHDLAIEGVDDNKTSVEKSGNNITHKKYDAIYLVKDLAGNTLKIDIRQQNKDKKDVYKIYSLQYNNDTPKILPNNEFEVIYKKDEKTLYILEQTFEIEKEIKISIRYNLRENKSTISIKSGNKKLKQTKSGLVLLQLLTDKGQLKTSY